MYWNETIETMDTERLRALQDERLREQVRYTYDRVPFYKKMFDDAGAQPGDIRTAKDLEKLPFTSKTDLRDNYPYGLFAVPMDEVVRIHASSGTTGKATVVGYTASDLALWDECVARALTCAGGTREDIVQVCYGYGLFTGGLGLHGGAERIGATKEQLYRALAVSDLITIHQKTGIGRLSAYCGAISAGVGAGAGICYLLGGGFTAVAHTVVNAVAILSGTICDGAKPSCAAKIAAAVDAGIMGYRMYLHDREFRRGEGIVSDSVDKTIRNVGILAQQGMLQTDRTILEIMQQK